MAPLLDKEVPYPDNIIMYDEEILQELKSLVGKNASAIAYANLRFYDAPQIAAVLDAAITIRDTPHYLSCWLFCAIGDDGTTEWRSPDGSQIATVTPEGDVQMNDSC